MKKTKVPNIMLFVFILCALIFNVDYASAQSLSKAKTAVEKEADLSWDDTQVKSKETQKLSFLGNTLTLTTISILPGGQKVTQTKQVPVDRLDTGRTLSFQHIVVEGMHFLRIFTKNDEKVVKTTTVFSGINNGDSTQDVVYTSSFTIYTDSKDRNISLKEKFEQLSSVSGQ